jgi:hypothetical protein
MPPTDRFIISLLPYGRWGDTLAGHFRRAVGEIDTEGEDIGEIDTEISWFPDRTYGGRTYIPAVARTANGYELFGYVSFSEGPGGPTGFEAAVDFTSEVAESNPDWKLDLNDEVIGTWRGEQGKAADMTLVWGAVEQAELVEDRFTLIAPDNYRSDFLEIKLWSKTGDELARESLYVEDDDDG